MSGEKHVEQAWSPSFTDEVNKILNHPDAPYARELVIEAITAGTFDSSEKVFVDTTHEIRGKIEHGGMGFTEEEAETLAAFIKEQRRVFLKSKGFGEDQVAKALGEYSYTEEEATK